MSLREESTDPENVGQYKVEQTPAYHSLQVTDILTRWGDASPDLCLVSQDGQTFYTQSIWFLLHSQFMRSLLQAQDDRQMVKIFVPISSNILINILKIISRGDTTNDTTFNPMDVMEGAKLLGISLEDLQIGLNKDNNEHARITEGVEVSNIKSEPVATVPFNENLDLGLEQETLNESEDRFESGEINASKDPIAFERRIKKARKTRKREYSKGNSEKLVCLECDKVFPNHSYLKKHIQIHSVEPKFSCDVCKKVFMQKVNLDRHVVVHTGTKQFSCNNCGKEFYRMDNSKRHMKKCFKILKT
jgi:ribosomal protein S26